MSGRGWPLGHPNGDMTVLGCPKRYRYYGTEVTSLAGFHTSFSCVMSKSPYVCTYVGIPVYHYLPPCKGALGLQRWWSLQKACQPLH